MENHRHQKQDGTYYKDKYDVKFLEQHGIQKDSTLAKEFEQIYGTSLRKGLEINIPGSSAKLKFQSYYEASEKHKVYYVPHPSDTIKSSDSEPVSAKS